MRFSLVLVAFTLLFALLHAFVFGGVVDVGGPSAAIADDVVAPVEPAAAEPTDLASVDASPGAAAPPIASGPSTNEILTVAADTINAYRTGGWLAALALVVAFLTALLRRPFFGKLLDLLPKRTRILVPLVLGCLAALFAHASGGLPWLEAVALAFLVGPTAVAFHQGLARSLLGFESPEAKTRRAAEAGKLVR